MNRAEKSADHPLKAKDVMTPDVVSVSPSTTIKALCKILAEHQITGAPVVDDNNRIVGIVSQTDILFSQLPRRVGDDTYDDIYDLFSPSPQPDGYRTTHRTGPRWVEDIMTKKVVVASEDMNVSELCSLMSERKIHRIPVAREGKLVGIVSALDILRVLAERGHGEGI